MPATPEEHRRLRQAFDEARALRGGARETYLQRLEAREPALARELSELLTLDEVPSSLDVPVTEVGEAWEDAEQAFPLPLRIGPYEVERQVGGGGMSTVYLARDPEVRRPLALKVLHPLNQAGTLAKRLQREAQILAQLDHPGIAQVYQAGVDRSTTVPLHYIAMEWIDGEPLLTHVREQQLSTAQRLDLVETVCEAVACAHRHGIVHRDLKSENILVTRQGAVRVIDFGVARVLQTELSITSVETSPGGIVGTLGHMAPEQLRGQPEEIDARSDVYALGTLLYELLTDAPPIELDGLTMHDATARVLAGRIVPMRQRGADIDWPLRALVERCLDPDASHRPADAQALLDALREVRNGRMRPTQQWAAWKQQMRRWRRAAPARGGIALLAAMLLTILITTLVVLDDLREPAEAYRGATGVVVLRDGAGRNLYRWELGGPDHVRGAVLCKRPRELGGGQVVAMTCSNEVEDPRMAGQLVLFDADHPEDGPIWSSVDLPIEPPIPNYEPRAAMRINASAVYADDFFPELPGLELAFYQTLDPWSPTTLRIVNLRGDLLFESWHNGTLSRLHWMPSRELLIITGLNSEASWVRRGHPGADPLYPIVVGALAIEPGRINRESWLVSPDAAWDDQVQWYRWVGPMAALEKLRNGFARTRGARVAEVGEDGFGLVVEFRAPEIDPQYPIEVMIRMKSDGTVLDRVASEAFLHAHAQGAAPSPDALQLLEYADLPPTRKAKE